MASSTWKVETGEENKNTFRKEVKVTEWAFDGTRKRKLSSRWRRMRNHDQKHRVLTTHHRANGRARRSYDVIVVPALYQFPDGRLRLVGLWEKRA